MKKMNLTLTVILCLILAPFASCVYRDAQNIVIGGSGLDGPTEGSVTLSAMLLIGAFIGGIISIWFTKPKE